MEKQENRAESQDLFYIRTNGYSGNSLIWWRPNSRGYTTNLDEAGKYTREEAERIVRGSGDETAYSVEKIDNAENGIFRTAHADYFPKSSADIQFESLKSNV